MKNFKIEYIEKLPIGEKIDIFSKITKLKKELRKL